MHVEISQLQEQIACAYCSPWPMQEKWVFKFMFSFVDPLICLELKWSISNNQQIPRQKKIEKTMVRPENNSSMITFGLKSFANRKNSLRPLSIDFWNRGWSERLFYVWGRRIVVNLHYKIVFRTYLVFSFSFLPQIFRKYPTIIKWYQQYSSQNLKLLLYKFIWIHYIDISNRLSFFGIRHFVYFAHWILWNTSPLSTSFCTSCKFSQ